MALGGLAGIASGVDTSALVEQLMGLERKGRDRMDLRQAQIGARQASLGTVQTKLLALRTATAGLRDVGTWADKQVVESSDPGRVAVERTGGAGPGGYSISVSALARAEQRTYDYAPPAEESVLEVGGTPVTLAAGATLDDAVAAVNGAPGTPVYATKVDGKLVLSARTTGTTSAFAATGSMLSGEVVRAGTDAAYAVDDGPVRYSTSNQVTDAVAGLKLTLKGVTSAPASVVVATPALDPEAVKGKLKAFVDAYNDLVRTTRDMVEVKPVRGATTADQARQGALYGDTGLSNMLSRLRFAVADPVAGNAAAMDELREAGVSTGATTGGQATADAKAGILTLDETQLTKALESPDAVRRMLGGLTGTDGLAQRVEGIVKSYTGAGGTITGRIAEGDTALTALQKQMLREDERLAARELRLKAQFAAMESALGAAQTQSAWLSGQLAQFAK